jgi:hypothetical protein
LKAMIRATLALAAAVGLLAAGRAGEPERLSGHYTIRWEEQSFQPCGSHEKWWVADPGPLMRSYRDLMQGGYGTVYVTVRAEVSEPGRFGHMGMFRRSVAVREVISARLAGEDDCRASDAAVE